MAVRHGYGKIAGTDALVFAYDTGDTVNSYKGEPTTNLQPSGVAFGHNSGTYGNVVTVVDAPEKGQGWKKVTISNRGSNFRIIQWTYTSMAANTMYCHSIEFDWGNMRDKGYSLVFDGTGTGTRAYYRPGDYDNTGSTSINSTMPDGKFMGTITHTATHSHAFFIRNSTTGVSGLNDYFYYKEYQVEVNSHPTQYTSGTRSATEGLIDLTGNCSIDLTDVSFDSNAQIDFDGTGDFFDVDGIADFQPNNTTDGFTVEYVFKSDTVTSTVFVGNLDSTNGWFQAPIATSGNGAYLYLNGSPGVVLTTDVNFRINSTNINKYHHVVMSLKWDDAANSFIMVDGVDQTNSRSNVSKQSTSGIPSPGLRVGKRGSSIWPANGKIPVIKIYNRALTADEVRNNYRHYKNRFNI